MHATLIRGFSGSVVSRIVDSVPRTFALPRGVSSISNDGDVDVNVFVCPVEDVDRATRSYIDFDRLYPSESVEIAGSNDDLVLIAYALDQDRTGSISWTAPSDHDVLRSPRIDRDIKEIIEDEVDDAVGDILDDPEFVDEIRDSSTYEFSQKSACSSHTEIVPLVDFVKINVRRTLRRALLSKKFIESVETTQSSDIRSYVDLAVKREIRRALGTTKASPDVSISCSAEVVESVMEIIAMRVKKNVRIHWSEIEELLRRVGDVGDDGDERRSDTRSKLIPAAIIVSVVVFLAVIIAAYLLRP